MPQIDSHSVLILECGDHHEVLRTTLVHFHLIEQLIETLMRRERGNLWHPSRSELELVNLLCLVDREYVKGTVVRRSDHAVLVKLHADEVLFRKV